MLTASSVTFSQARTEAASISAYLVAINDPAEHAFLDSAFGGTSARYWIGLSDEVIEGQFRWDSGEIFNYSNFCPGEPNNGGAGEDAVELSYLGACHGWNDHPGTLIAGGPNRGIIEISTFVHSNNNHAYFMAPPRNYAAARLLARSVGGYLVSINSAGEYTFVTNTFSNPGRAGFWTGLSDEVTEGIFVWDSGEPLTFSTWCVNEPNGGAGENYVQQVRLHNGTNACTEDWNDVPGNVVQYVVVEIPLKLSITAPEGPGSLLVANDFGAPGKQYFTAITLAPGLYPNGWLFGLDIRVQDLLTELSVLAPPFRGNLDSLGRSRFTIPAGLPPGLSFYGVTITFDSGGAFIEASAPASSTLL
jgi:hypothetical protein